MSIRQGGAFDHGERQCLAPLRAFAVRNLATARAEGARFWVRREGSSAVEFALVVGMFLWIVLSILELGIAFIATSGVNLAADTFAKQIRTGQVQAPGLATASSSGKVLSLADATKQMCKQVHAVSVAHCLQQLQLDVRPISSFQNMVASSPVSGRTFDASGLCYYSGNAGDIVEMRVYYLYNFFNPMLTVFSSISTFIGRNASSSGRYFLIKSTQVFKTENYSGSGNTGAGC